MKKLKFEDRFVSIILSRKKTTTWRMNDEKNIEKGDCVLLCKKDGKGFAKALVLWTKEKNLGDMEEEDEKDIVFGSDEEMYSTFSAHYGTQVTPTTKLKVIKFKIVEMIQ